LRNWPGGQDSDSRKTTADEHVIGSRSRERVAIGTLRRMASPILSEP
jgi:hypothetical protein